MLLIPALFGARVTPTSQSHRSASELSTLFTFLISSVNLSPSTFCLDSRTVCTFRLRCSRRLLSRFLCLICSLRRASILLSSACSSDCVMARSKDRTEPPVLWCCSGLAMEKTRTQRCTRLVGRRTSLGLPQQVDFLLFLGLLTRGVVPAAFMTTNRSKLTHKVKGRPKPPPQPFS